MSVALVTRFQDSETDTKQDALTLYFPDSTTLATFDDYIAGYLPLVDALTGAQIVSCEVLYNLGLPSGLKTDPVAASLNERGGLIGFDMSIPGKRDSLRIPAILTSIMSGDEFSLADEDVAAFIAWVTSTQETIRPFNTWVTQYENAIYGRKSFRRK